jgi:L-alanine-DL-glutamate epimerase-like enolase superfamily enzyme
LTAGDRIERPISVTIGICGMDETTALARRHLDQGFSILKIKGGHDARTDVRRLRAVRELAGPDIEIALDANQGYSMADVSLLSDAQPELRLAYLEQPTPRDDHRMLVHASAVSAVPVMADETVRSVHDVQRLVELGGVGLVNVKLQKVGGAGAAARIDRVASEAGIPLMLGCMDESALSIAAALRFGAAHTNVRWYDLDGHLDLEGDPFAGLLTLRDGVLRLDDRSGIGASMHSDPMSPFG